MTSTTTAVATDTVLLQATLTAQEAAGVARPAAWLAACPALDPAQLRAVWSAGEQALYLYLSLAQARPMASSELAPLEQAFQRAFPAATGVRASRLTRVFDTAGASAGERPGCHYVVETDPEAGWAQEIANWYDSEHMPGLASVAGCVRASRFLNHDHGPASYACYDLVTPQTLGSEAWLAVRHTDWSSRARPHFTNTRRTMFELLLRGECLLLL